MLLTSIFSFRDVYEEIKSFILPNNQLLFNIVFTSLAADKAQFPRPADLALDPLDDGPLRGSTQGYDE